MKVSLSVLASPAKSKSEMAVQAGVVEGESTILRNLKEQ